MPGYWDIPLHRMVRAIHRIFCSRSICNHRLSQLPPPPRVQRLRYSGRYIRLLGLGPTIPLILRSIQVHCPTHRGLRPYPRVWRECRWPLGSTISLHAPRRIHQRGAGPVSGDGSTNRNCCSKEGEDDLRYASPRRRLCGQVRR